MMMNELINYEVHMRPKSLYILESLKDSEIDLISLLTVCPVRTSSSNALDIPVVLKTGRGFSSL